MRMYRAGSGERFLCERCFRLSGEEQGEAHYSDVARFFFLLACPTEAHTQTELPIMPADLACPQCGLSYEQFSTGGRLGCADCYTTFAPAVHSALAMLRRGI
ncbi:MAG TPA: hypothetical protein VNJ09_03735 [Chthonomonadales bacterium]|nr:hypothetical protein [Chthonomonadales bacterium]